MTRTIPWLRVLIEGLAIVGAARGLVGHALCWVLLLLGCSGPTDVVDAAGTYQLTSVEAAPLPYVLSQGFEVTQGELDLRESGTFRMLLAFTSPPVGGSGNTLATFGDYTVTGAGITFTPNGGSAFQPASFAEPFSGTVNGDLVEVIDSRSGVGVEGLTLSFRR